MRGIARAWQAPSLVQLVELHAGDDLAVAGAELLGRGWSGQSSTTIRRLAGALPRPRRGPSGRRGAGGGRTGSRPARTHRRGPGRSPSPCRISIRSASPSASTVACARATESGSNSTPTSSSFGKRRPSRRASARRRNGCPRRDLAVRQVDRQLRGAASTSWKKKTAMSCRVSRSIAARYRSGRLPRACPSGRSRPGRPNPSRRPPHGRTGHPGTPAASRRGGSRPRPHRATSVRPRTSRSCASEAHDQAATAARSVAVTAASSSGVMPPSPASRILANSPSSMPRTSHERWNRRGWRSGRRIDPRGP